MDGARLFNAAVYLKVPASRIVRDFASATFCISKGLGAPVGAILVGDKELIHKQVSTFFLWVGLVLSQSSVYVTW
jgi:threonine aldolase